ncbi:hypothetical protein ACSSVY_001315, partial [Roseovarius sp. MBR-51]
CYMRAARSKALAPNWPTFAPPQWPNFTPPLTASEKKKKIKVIKGVLATLTRLQKKLEDASINPSHIAGVAERYKFRIGLIEASIGHEKRTKKGGVNWQARDAAAMVAFAFAYHGAKLTFGTRPGSDEPSTAFGRAVKGVLDALDIRADWRRPTEDAIKLAIKIEHEIHRAQETGFYD